MPPGACGNTLSHRPARADCRGSSIFAAAATSVARRSPEANALETLSAFKCLLVEFSSLLRCHIGRYLSDYCNRSIVRAGVLERYLIAEYLRQHPSHEPFTAWIHSNGIIVPSTDAA